MARWWLVLMLASCGDAVVDGHFIGTPLQVFRLPAGDPSSSPQVILWWTSRFEVAGVSRPVSLDRDATVTGYRSFALYEPPPPGAVLTTQGWTSHDGPAAFGVWVALDHPPHSATELVVVEGVVQPPFELLGASHTSLMFIPAGSRAAATEGYHRTSFTCPYTPVAFGDIELDPLVPPSSLDGGSLLDLLHPGCRSPSP